MKLYAAILFCLLVTGSSVLAQPIKLHPANPHYFFYQGKAAILVGSGEHYGSVVNLDFDYKKYLQTVAHGGLNTSRLFTGAYIEKVGDFGIMKNSLAPADGRLLLPWKRSVSPGYILGGNKFDLNQWDDNYFVRLKDFLAEAVRQSVIVEVNLFSSHYAGGWNYSVFNRANNINNTDTVLSRDANTLLNGNILGYQEKYVKKLVKELNGFENIYFEIQNEPWADQTDTVLNRNEYSSETEWRSTIQVVSQRSDAWQKKVAGWIVETEAGLPKKHLISQNISNFFYPIAYAYANISIYNFHYALPEAVSANYYLNKVIGFNETGFAGSSDKTYRRQAWRFMMAGGGLFNQLDYSFSVGSEDGQDTNYKAPGGGSPALRKQFHVLKDFFDRLDLVHLQPDNSLVKAAPGARTQALREGKNRWIVYYESMSLLQPEIMLELPAGSYRASWKDVISGESLKTEDFNTGKLKVPTGNNDKVVVIEKL